MSDEAPNICPHCSHQFISIYQPNTTHLEGVECIGPKQHRFAVLPVEGTEPPRYRLGPEDKAPDAS